MRLLFHTSQHDSDIYAYLLGHVFLKQFWVSFDWPSQSLPPSEGGGLSHVRVLSCVPEPHFTEHSAHSVHVVQPPSTTKEGSQGCVKLGQGWSNLKRNQHSQLNTRIVGLYSFFFNVIFISTKIALIYPLS